MDLRSLALHPVTGRCFVKPAPLWYVLLMSAASPSPRPSNGRRSFSHRAIWLLVANLTLGVILLSLIRPQITEFIELKLLDLKFLYRGPVAAGPDLAIVAIDDDSLKSLGRWPWSRETFAMLLQRLKEAQPKVIGLDIIFAEKSDSAVSISLERIRQKCSQHGPESAKFL
jgi:CHASE2 domain-containing sensor protein